jgi:hypothetical protein
MRVATPQAARGWALSRCRHFKNQSCRRRGSVSLQEPILPTPWVCFSRWRLSKPGVSAVARLLPVPVSHRLHRPTASNALLLVPSHKCCSVPSQCRDPFRIRPAPRYANGGQTAFSDGFPVLLATSESLRDLNSKLLLPVSMSCFRPNVVVTGAAPWAEDTWRRVRPCCVLDPIEPSLKSLQVNGRTHVP